MDKERKRLPGGLAHREQQQTQAETKPPLQITQLCGTSSSTTPAFYLINWEREQRGGGSMNWWGLGGWVYGARGSVTVVAGGQSLRAFNIKKMYILKRVLAAGRSTSLLSGKWENGEKNKENKDNCVTCRVCACGSGSQNIPIPQTFKTQNGRNSGRPTFTHLDADHSESFSTGTYLVGKRGSYSSTPGCGDTRVWLMRRSGESFMTKQSIRHSCNDATLH